MLLISKIKNSLKKINTSNYKTFYIAGNIYNFGFTYEETKNFSKFFFNELKNKIGINKNIVVPTATLNLINKKDVVFEKKTKSYTMGNFSEYVRNLSYSVRSDHPLWSFTGVGKEVGKILNKTSYSAYGKDSVFDKLQNNNTMFISMGESNNSLGMVHYAEHIVGVPYRFNKEFYIKVKKKNKIAKQYCLLGVRFDSSKVVRDENKKIIKILKKEKILKSVSLSKGKLYYADYIILVNKLIEILNNKPNIWLKNENISQKEYFKG